MCLGADLDGDIVEIPALFQELCSGALVSEQEAGGEDGVDQGEAEAGTTPEEPPAKEPPVEEAAVEEVPVEGTPAEASVEGVPVEAPVDEAPAEELPVA